MTSIVESDITCPHSVWFTSFLFTGRAGRTFMLMHANHSFLPVFGYVVWFTISCIPMKKESEIVPIVLGMQLDNYKTTYKQ